MVRPFNTTEANAGTGDATVQPTAPPLIAIESDGDFSDPDRYVDFLVLGNKENYSIRAERKPIVDSNTQLAHIITGAASNVTVVDGKFVVRDVDKDNFEIFVRYLETKFIKFHTASHMLLMLQLANRYECRQLEIHCVKELDLHLTVDNVTEVFRALWYYRSFTPSEPPPAPSEGGKKRRRKPKATEKATPVSPLTPEEYFSALLNNCLQLIDMHAEDVLAQEVMLQLRFEELEMVVKREALQLSSEIVLLDLLARWSLEECNRKQLEVTGENRRRVLGELCYTPRYLTMTRKEFESARERIELLDPIESRLVGDLLAGKKPSDLTPEQLALVEQFRRQRPAFPLLPIPLSSRSNARNYPKKMRKGPQPLQRRSPSTERKSCCDRLFLNCISVFACIFD